MKVVILAGGFGTRLSEETVNIPKPMVEIGGKPILWHIMKIYSHYGLNDFVICLGYKGYIIKEYFANYHRHHTDFQIDLKSGDIQYLKGQGSSEPWTVSLIDTGSNTMTGGRIKRVQDHIGRSPFCMTYGDGVSNVDIGALLEHHKKHGKLATVTAVRQPGRFGALDIENDTVTSVREKTLGDGNWINSGFFVLEPEALDTIAGDHISWEKEPLQTLASQNQITAFKHEGFWQPMDTLRERQQLQESWDNGTAPWKIWT